MLIFLETKSGIKTLFLFKGLSAILPHSEYVSSFRTAFCFLKRRWQKARICLIRRKYFLWRAVINGRTRRFRTSGGFEDPIRSRNNVVNRFRSQILTRERSVSVRSAPDSNSSVYSRDLGSAGLFFGRTFR
jgi:hypothetical protein